MRLNGEQPGTLRPLTRARSRLFLGMEGLPQLPMQSDRTPSRQTGNRKRLLLICAIIICIGIIMGIGYRLVSEATPTTDKAVVEGYTYPVSSSIDGTIAEIFVLNRQYVKAGDLLAKIDKRDLETKLAALRIDWVQAKAMLPAIETQLSKTQAEVETTESRMFHRDKQLTEATSDYQYISKSRAKKVVSLFLFSRAKKEYESALSEYLRTRTTLGSTVDRLREVQGLRDVNFSKMQTSETTMRQIENQLSLTDIYAPANGHVVFDKTNLANHLSAGEPFLKLVGDDPWVVANFKENQLKHIKLGQSVTVRIEVVKQRTFHGEVVNIAPLARGSGGPMALLLSMFTFVWPPETVLVKIRLDSESVLGLADRIDPGLNASVEIDAG